MKDFDPATGTASFKAKKQCFILDIFNKKQYYISMYVL